MNLEKLTPRQRQVQELVKDGLTTREIAAVLGIAVKSARNHRQRASKKQRLGSVSFSP